MKLEWPTEEQINDCHRRLSAEKRAVEMRQVRLDLTCAALTGIIALEGSHKAELNAERAVENADACLALLYPTDEARP